MGRRRSRGHAHYPSPYVEHGRERLIPFFKTAGKTIGVNWRLLMAIARKESGLLTHPEWNTKTGRRDRNYKHVGLMQVSDKYFVSHLEKLHKIDRRYIETHTGKKIGEIRDSHNEEWYNPAINIALGAIAIKSALDKCKNLHIDWPYALAMYNSGEGAFDTAKRNYGSRFTGNLDEDVEWKQSKGYIKEVVGFFAEYLRMYPM